MIAAAASLIACDISKGISDFGNNVANPELVSINGPGQRLATGHYNSPLVDPWGENGPVIIAFEFIGQDPHLAMRPMDGSAGCDTGLAYSSIVRDKLANRTQLIAYKGPSDSNGRGPVHFVDHACNEYGQPIQNANLPDLLYSDPPGYLVNAVDYTTENNVPVVSATHLFVVDPWDGTSTVLAANLTWWTVLSSNDSTIAVIDGGHFKIFNAQQQPTSDVGTAVTEIAFLPGQSGAFALVDGGTLSTYQSVTDTSPVAIANDACQPIPDSSGYLFYFSPCETRQLQCYRSDTGKSTLIDSEVSGLVSSRTSADGTGVSVLYTKSNPAGNGSDLWMASPGASQALIAAQFSRLFDWSSAPALEVISLANADATTGQAVRHTPTGDTVLLDSVSAQFTQGVLANFDTTSLFGDLYSPLQVGQSPQFVIAGVPYVAPPRSPIVASSNEASAQYGTAIINAATGAMGSIGKLTLLRYPTASSPGPDSPRTIASNVPVGSYSFFSGMTAIGYIENWDTSQGTGDFVVDQLDLDALSDVSDQVAEFLEVTWPSEGVMYIIPSGDRAGIWLAKAQ